MSWSAIALWYVWAAAVFAALARRPLWKFTLAVHRSHGFRDEPTALHIAFFCFCAFLWPIQAVGFLLGFVVGLWRGLRDRRRR